RISTEAFYSHFETRIGIFTGSHIGNLTDLQAAFKRDTPYLVRGFSYTINNPQQHVIHDLFKYKSTIRLSANNSITGIYAFQKNHREEYDIKRNPNNKAPDFNYIITTQTLDVYLSHRKIHGWNHTVGLSGIFQRNSYEGRFFIPGFYNQGVGAYGISKYSIHKIDFEAGIRFDMKSLEAFYNKYNVLLNPKYLYARPSATVSATYKPSTMFSHVLILSHTWRAPSANELYSDGLHLSVAALERGDSSLKPETSEHISYTFKVNTKRLYLEAEVYSKYILNFINLVPSFPAQLTVRGAFPVFKYTQTDALLKGINVSAKYQVTKKLAGQLNANMLWGTDLINRNYLSQMPSARFGGKAIYSVKKLFVNFNAAYTLRQYRYNLNSDYVDPPKSYALFGIDIGNTFTIKHHSIKINASVTNIFNASYRDYLNRFRYFTDEQGRNFTVRITIPVGEKIN
ncbi:MAG: TonB-dependent receptor, partial [Bacteroidia bacterium]|nr:TonB-dependent receptor [Bacteroidia bacterium]